MPKNEAASNIQGIIDEDLIVEALNRVYSAADARGIPRPPLNEIYAAMRNAPGLGKLTMVMVKNAAKTVKTADIQANQSVSEGDDEGLLPEGISPYDTYPQKCQASGSGLEEATVRHLSYFSIEAVDVRGKLRSSGGDAFFVAIRGPSRTRAKVTDNFDGTYSVAWKPNVSGTYSIAISHSGVQLPGSPFTVHTQTCAPCASRCLVRGDALHKAISRATQAFEILFKDKAGQVARAVDLDIFVEPLPPGSPRSRAGHTEQLDADAAAKAQRDADAGAREKRRKEKAEHRATKDKSRRGGAGGTVATPGFAPAAAVPSQPLTIEPEPLAADLVYPSQGEVDYPDESDGSEDDADEYRRFQR